MRRAAVQSPFVGSFNPRYSWNDHSNDFVSQLPSRLEVETIVGLPSIVKSFAIIHTNGCITLSPGARSVAATRISTWTSDRKRGHQGSTEAVHTTNLYAVSYLASMLLNATIASCQLQS